MATLSSKPLAALAALVIKRGVSLGGLAFEARAQVLALVWAGLPAAPMTERQINDSLTAQLAGVVACLDTDHVELRRWLVDAGWLTRDGFGREYRRRPLSELPASLQALATPLLALALPDWVAQAESAQAAQREAHRQAWQAGQASPDA